jgi:hypothetical protein
MKVALISDAAPKALQVESSNMSLQLAKPSQKDVQLCWHVCAEFPSRLNHQLRQGLMQKRVLTAADASGQTKTVSMLSMDLARSSCTTRSATSSSASHFVANSLKDKGSPPLALAAGSRTNSQALSSQHILSDTLSSSLGDGSENYI